MDLSTLKDIYPRPFDYDYEFKYGNAFNINEAADIYDAFDVVADYPWPSAAAETTLVSSLAADDSVGTGARTVRVFGLDTNGLLINQLVTTDGVTPVVLPVDMYRVFRAKAIGVGSGGVNAGNIDIKHGATILARIKAGKGQTLMSIYTVPADYMDAMIDRLYVRVSRSNVTPAADLELQVRENGESWQTKATPSIRADGSDYDYSGRIAVVGPLADIRVFTTSISAAANVEARFDIVLAKKG